MTEDLTLRAMLLSMLFLGFATSRRMRRRADEAGGEVPRSADTPGVAAALRRFGTLYYGTILLWLVYPPRVAWAGVHLSGGLRWLGIGLVAGGLALGLAALWHPGGSVPPTALARTKARLVKSGPYRWVRHPLYTSMWLSVPGVGLATVPAIDRERHVMVVDAGTALARNLVERWRKKPHGALQSSRSVDGCRIPSLAAADSRRDLVGERRRSTIGGRHRPT